MTALTNMTRAQVAIDQDLLLMVALSLSYHANDQAEVAPILDTRPEALGTPPAGATCPFHTP